MKRKIVLRLLAAVMAATLVVTGVPSTALTGIETVYASGEEGGEATSIAEYTVSVTGVDSLTYDGKDKNAGDAILKNVTVTKEQANLTVTTDYTLTIEKKGADNRTWTTVTEIKDAGDYRIKATGTGSYKDSAVSSEFSVAKKEVTAVLTVEPKVYDGTAKVKVHATVLSGVVDGDEVTIGDLNGVLESADAGDEIKLTSVSDFRIISGHGNTNYKVTGYSTDGVNGKILKAEGVNAPAAPAAPTLSSTDTQITVTAAAEEPTGFTYEYAISTTTTAPTDASAWSESGEFTKASEVVAADTQYYGFVRIKATANNDASAATVSASTIALKKTSFDTVNAVVNLGENTKDLAYDGTDKADAIKKAVTVTYGDDNDLIGTVNYDLAIEKQGASDDTWTTVTEIRDAGTYRIVATAKNNYSGSKTSESFTVAKKKITLTVAVAGGSKTYDETTSVNLTASAADNADLVADDEITVTGLTGTLSKTGSNDAVTDGATISNVVSTAANVTGKNSGNYEITYTADGVNAKIIPYIEIKAETSVSVAYGETVSLGASNSVDAAMTYEISGLFASQVFDVSEDGTITCKLYDTDLSKLTYKVTVKFKNPDVYKDYELKATESKEITITATQATATIKLGESVANNAITVSKEGVTAKSIKTAIAATLTYAKDSTNSDAKTTYDISDELVYKFSSESTGTYSTTLPDVTNLEKVYVKVSYAGTTGIKSVESEAITVTLDKKEVSAAPTISGTTTFTENTTVTITAASGAKIYYTTNGDTPTTTTGDNCFEYTAAFTLSAGATVKAIAVEDGKLQSAVVSQEFTKLSATAKTVTVTVKDATVIIGESYAPEIVVNDGTTDLANVKTIYTVYNEQGKEVQLSDAITTAGKYIISADVQDKTEYNVTTYQSGELTVKTASEAVKDAEDAAQKAIEEATTTKKGDTVVIDGNTYTVTDVTKKTVSFTSVGKSTTYVYIASTITINGDTYKVTAVNAGAFKNNKKITNVVIQGSITAIAKNQFSGCTALTSVTIPATVTVVGAAAFSGCTKLSSVTFMGTKVVTIGEEAFKNCKALTSIDIPSSVTAMTSGVFYNCTSLKTVNFKGTGLTAIGANTFYGCKALTSIVITKNVKTIGDNAFSGCAALKTVTFKGTAVTSIGKNAFYGCKKLASIALTKNVKTIGASAFQNCSALKTITIKSTVLSKIGTKAFTGTAKKATAKVPAKKLAAYKKLLKSYKTITVKK